MNICLINKENNICENVAVFEKLATAVDMCDEYIAIEQMKGYGIGDIYKDGKWEHAAKDEEVIADDETLHTQ